MATRRATVDLPVDELLIDGEERNPGLTWPLAVDRWLEARLEQAEGCRRYLRLARSSALR